MKQIVTAFFCALLFGLGLGVAGMTLPSKVVGFLDITGAWDPSLMFVMIGAIGVHAIAYRVIRRRVAPLLTEKFHLPVSSVIDHRLIIGAILFGLGWGLAGFCPGPSLVSLATGASGVWLFVVSMLMGIFAGRKILP